MATLHVPGALSALRHRNYRLLWTGLFISNAGSWLQHVGQSWLVLELSNRPFYLGLLGFTRAVPLILFGLFGGAVADRFNRRRVLFVTQGVMTAQAVALWLLTVTGRVEVWHVIALSVVNAVAMAFDQPARHAMMPSLVPKEDLLAAITLNAVAFNGAAVLGPSLAGPVVQFLGIAGCFLLNAVTFAAIFAALFRLEVPPGGGRRTGSIGEDLLAGLRYVRRQPVILALLGAVAGVSLFARPFQQFISVLARDALGTGVGGYGLLQAAPGLGTVLFALAVAGRGDRGDKGRLLLAAGLTLPAALLAVAWSPWYWAAFVALVAAGGSASVYMTTTNALIQQQTDPAVLGRVLSLYTMTGLAMMPLGQLPMGAAVARVGVRWAFTGGAVLAALAVLAANARVPELRRLP